MTFATPLRQEEISSFAPGMSFASLDQTQEMFREVELRRAE